MRRAPILLLTWFAIAGCSADTPPPPGEPGGAVTSLAAISGPWDIASFDGYEPIRLSDGVRRAFVDIGKDGLSYAIECNYSGNPARIDEAGVLHDVGDGSRVQTLMGCGPEREARDSALFGFFATKPRVSWAPGGRLRMTNGRSELILERPEARRLAHLPRADELDGSWVPQSLVQLMGSGHSGWGFQGEALLTIADGQIRYSGCGGFAFSFRYTAQGKLDTDGGPDRETCGTDSQSSGLLRVLRAGPLVEKIADGRLALSAGQEVITLQSQAKPRPLREQPPPGVHMPPPPGAHMRAPQPPQPPPGR